MNVEINFLPVDLAGEVLRHVYLRAKETDRLVSVKYPLQDLPRKAVALVTELLAPEVNYFGWVDIGNLITVISQTDGDELLVIYDRTTHTLYWNTDAKKSYGWNRQYIP